MKPCLNCLSTTIADDQAMCQRCLQKVLDAAWEKRLGNLFAWYADVTAAAKQEMSHDAA
jgi:hypothetical protein